MKRISVVTFLPVRVDIAPGFFALTAFASAVLLFLVEPMFVKMALPRLGGSSEVWTACVLFFQLTLLAAYTYAHVLGRLRRVRDQAIVHAVVCALAALTLPAAIPAAWNPKSNDNSVLWLLTTMLVTIGPSFFVLAATSPLLQAWFARARPERNPYPLYAASNIGSLFALVLYPFAIEPVWGLRAQSTVWALGFYAFAALLAVCATFARPAIFTPSATVVSRRTPLTVARRLRWIALAFVPASLMLSVTTYLSERVAPIPLMWALPLGIYLASFVIVFASHASRTIALANRFTPLVLAPLAIIFSVHGALPAQVEIVLHLMAFAGLAIVCHGALAHDRPDPSRLTEFYLFVALGGLFGSAFNSIAPLVFHDVYEYPIVLILACFAFTPRGAVRCKFNRWDVAFPIALSSVFALGLATLPTVLALILTGAAALLAYSFVDRPVRFALGLAGILAVSAYHAAAVDEHIERNFYGVKHVLVSNGFHELIHGHTVHGAENYSAGRERVPLTYYASSGPLGDIFAGPLAGHPAVAVVGLGAGTSACYRRAGAKWTFFEIDPGVVSIARNPRFFRYLTDCAPDSPIIVGDGRLSLAAQPPAAYDLIILDAYASDAVPTHLLTREAMQLFLSRLRPHGLIAFHISNRYFDFSPLIAALADDAHAVVLGRLDLSNKKKLADFIAPSSWMVVGRDVAALSSLARDPRWKAPPTRSARVWTDDYSSIVTVLRPL